MIAKGTYEWSLGVRNNGRSRTTCSSPVVLPSEYRSVEDFCSRIHRTLFKSFKRCASIATTWDTVPAGIPGHQLAGIPCRATMRHAAGAVLSAVRAATMPAHF